MAGLLKHAPIKEKRAKKKEESACHNWRIFYFCRRVSPVRPAPAELLQGLTTAKVGGRSGAIQIAYPPANVAQLARAADL